jgi:D-3-phosphoglycerate dehydrogenase
MTRRRLLITDHPWGNAEIERNILAPAGCDVVEAPDGAEETLIALARDVDAIATCWAKVTQPVIAAARNCRIVARMGIGLDNIDIPAASARGMLVTNIPDYCVQEVADHALALLLACARQIAFFHWQTKQGEYDLSAAPPMYRLSGRTLGLIGFGRIARALRDRALPLGLTVLAHSSSGTDYGTGCPMVALDELLERSDFVSLHAPLSDRTHHLLGQARFARMKPTAVVINTSRGGLIDHRALWEHLQQGGLAGAALDVFDPEPPDLSEPLFRDPRVIVTPHAAFVSRESVIELRERVARQILDVLEGRCPEHVVNPDVLGGTAQGA